MRSAQNVMMEVVDALNGTSNATTRAQTGMKLFGSSFDEMSKIIDLGSDGIRELGNEFNDLISAEEVEILVKYGDELSKVQEHFRNLQVHIGADLAEALLPFVETLDKMLEHSDEISEYLRTFVELMNDIQKVLAKATLPVLRVVDTFKSLWNVIKDVGDAFDDLFSKNYSSNGSGSFLDGMKDALHIGHNASGSSNWQGGLTWVGEEGPEIVNLPSGSQIYNNSQSNNIAGNNTYNITMNCDLSSMRSLQDVVDAVSGLSDSRRSFA